MDIGNFSTNLRQNNSIEYFCDFAKNHKKSSELSITALINFFSYKFNQNNNVNIEKVNLFFFNALHFTFWQKKQLSLLQNVLEVLKDYQSATGNNISLHEILDLRSFEVLPINNSSVFEDFLTRKLSTPDGQTVIRQGSKDLFFAITLSPTEEIAIQQFATVIYSYKGEIQPLSASRTIRYNKELSIKPNINNTLLIDSNNIAIFSRIFNPALTADNTPSSNTPEIFNATLLKGYTFSPSENAKLSKPEHISFLFAPLKRLENHYIDLKSTPHYLELCRKIESNVKEMENYTLNVTSFDSSQVLDLIQETQSTINDVYPNDKWLNLLLENLKKTFFIKTQGKAKNSKQADEESIKCQEIHPIEKNQELIL